MEKTDNGFDISIMAQSYNGGSYSMEEYEKLSNEEWMGEKPLSLEATKDRIFNLILDEISTDDREKIQDAQNMDDLVEVLDEAGLLTRDNTYNYSWWGGTFEIGMLNNWDEKVDLDYPTILFLSKHRGGDVRGNYESFEAFGLDDYGHEQFPLYMDRQVVHITSPDGKTLIADTEDMEGYTLMVVEDEIGDMEEGDTTNLDELGDIFGFDAWKYYAKGGSVGEKTYKIKGVSVDYYEDDYEQGEGDLFHDYHLNSSEFPYETKFSNKKDFLDTIKEYVTYADLKDEDLYIDDDSIQTSALVKFEKGSDWDEFSAPTESEKELWKKGEMKLYVANFWFPFEVYKKEKLDFAKGGEVGKARTGNPFKEMQDGYGFTDKEVKEMWQGVADSYKSVSIEEVIKNAQAIGNEGNDRVNLESEIVYLYPQKDLDKYEKQVGFNRIMAKGGKTQGQYASFDKDTYGYSAWVTDRGNWFLVEMGNNWNAPFKDVVVSKNFNVVDNDTAKRIYHIMLKNKPTSYAKGGEVDDKEYRINKLKSKIEFFEDFLEKTKYADDPNDQFAVTESFKKDRAKIKSTLQDYKKELKEYNGVNYAKGGKTKSGKTKDELINEIEKWEEWESVLATQDDAFVEEKSELTTKLGNLKKELWEKHNYQYAKGGKVKKDFKREIRERGREQGHNFLTEDQVEGIYQNYRINEPERNLPYAKGGKVKKDFKREIRERGREQGHNFLTEDQVEGIYQNYRINEPERNLPYAKGGKIDYSERKSKDFKLGELVYDTRNKRYGTIIGIYDGSPYEVRLDSDGMQPTEYLRKLGEDGDKGTKKQLFEGVSSIERLRREYPENNYPKLINNPFYAKGGKTQGYDDKLDESLGSRTGSKGTKSQSYKSRRDESKGEEKALGRRAYASVGTMDKGRRKKTEQDIEKIEAEYQEAGKGVISGGIIGIVLGIILNK